MKFDVKGIDDCLEYLQAEAQLAPRAAKAGVEGGLQVLEADIRAELDRSGSKVVERKNNLRTFFVVGRRTVAIVLPGVHKLNWIAVTGGERHGFASEASALQHARRYAEQLLEADADAGYTIAVQASAEGAEGTLTSDREDDDAVQRAWDESQAASLDAAEGAVLKALNL